MADEKFIDFARRRLKFGTPRNDVAATLRVNGLSEAEIEEVLTAAVQGAPASAPPILAYTPAPAPEPAPVPALAPVEPAPPIPAPDPPPPPPPEPPQMDPLPVAPPQEAPAQEMSHISVMPRMAPAEAPVVAPAPAAPREPVVPSVSTMQQTLPPAPEEPAPIIYAGFWRRVIAALIDTVIFTFLYAAVVIGVSFTVGSPNTASIAEYVKGVGGLTTTALSLLILALYHPLFEASAMQGSLGKHFVGLFVTDMEGRRIGFWRALMRNLAKVTSSFILGIGYLMVAFTKQKQGLHDIIAGCLVLRHEHP